MTFFVLVLRPPNTRDRTLRFDEGWRCAVSLKLDELAMAAGPEKLTLPTLVGACKPLIDGAGHCRALTVLRGSVN